MTILAMAQTALAADIVAHRGASEDAPENTLAAFRLAWRQDAEAIELDVHATKDGQLICLHDATLTRTAGVKKKIADLTLDQVRLLDVGAWKSAQYKGERLPTLAEALAVVPAGKRVLIEVKVGPEVVPAVAKAIAESGLKPAQVAIIAFDAEVIAAAKAAMPRLKAFWLVAFKLKDGKWSTTHDQVMQTLHRIKADGLDVGFAPESLEMVNQILADRLRQANLELHVWTVDDPGLARKAIALGARSITTNRPAKLRQAIDASR